MSDRLLLGRALCALALCAALRPALAVNNSAAEALAAGAWHGDAASEASLRAQAATGDIDAEYWLGMVSQLRHDFASALSWYRRAAAAGNTAAEVNLGVLYAGGHGVARNPATAATWYARAAAHGNATAQNDLGICYHDGDGVARDDARAAALFLRAAEQGHAEALDNLGLLWARGEGVPRDMIVGYALHLRARQRTGQTGGGDDATGLTPAQLRQAHALATAMATRGVGAAIAAQRHASP